MKTPEPQTPARGFTLLEVLVALVIIGLGMIAVFNQLNQSLIATSMLRNKTLAHWIATDRIAELRLKGEFPGIGERSDEIEMAGQRWVYTMKFTDVGVENFRRVDVNVAFADKPNRSLGTVTGFLSKAKAAAAGSGASWPPVDPNAALTEGQTS